MSHGSDNARFAEEFLATGYGNPDNPLPPEWAQVLNVVGEAGEFAEAYRRYSGHARRTGDLDETSMELADVVISAYTAANIMGIDLDEYIKRKQEIIMTRGFKDKK